MSYRAVFNRPLTFTLSHASFGKPVATIEVQTDTRVLLDDAELTPDNTMVLYFGGLQTSRLPANAFRIEGQRQDTPKYRKVY